MHKFGGHLPASLLRLLISKQIFKVGSSIKADFTQLKRQFPQLGQQNSFNLINLKEYCINWGIIPCKGSNSSGALDALAKKLLEVYMIKDDNVRKSEDWKVPGAETVSNRGTRLLSDTLKVLPVISKPQRTSLQSG